MIRWASQPESIASLSAAKTATTATNTNIHIENPPSSFYAPALFCKILAECDVLFTIDSTSSPGHHSIGIILYIIHIINNIIQQPSSNTKQTHIQQERPESIGTIPRIIWMNEPSLNCNKKKPWWIHYLPWHWEIIPSIKEKKCLLCFVFGVCMFSTMMFRHGFS